MPSSVSSHSHRSTTKTSHKPFKSRKATKGALKEISKGLYSSQLLNSLVMTQNRQDI
jgi:pre-rRNA-processing protein TSR1